MRLAAITDEISQSLEDAIAVMLEHGAEGAELRGLWGTNVSEIDCATRDRTARLLREAGLRVCSIASPVYKTDLFAEGTPGGEMHLAKPLPLEKQLELLQHCLDVANFFESPVLRIFTFWKRGELTPAIEDRIVDALGETVPYAEKAGVIIGLENEHSCYIGTGEETKRVLQRVDSKWVRAIWDAGNAYWAGEDPVEGCRVVQPWVVHLHVKDAERVPEGGYRWSVIGEGEIDFRTQFQFLRKQGYNGYVSLETHAKREGMNGAQVSALCFKALRELIKGTESGGQTLFGGQ